MDASLESADLTAAGASYRSLTDKQREVLDLVIEHKSSKEIARLLGISPYTVDQRISAARVKLGAPSGGELARRYNRLRDLCEGSAYGSSQFVEPYPPPLTNGQEELAGALFTLEDAGARFIERPWAGQRPPTPFLEGIDRRFGVLGRFGFVVSMALGLAVTLLIVLAAAQALNSLL